MPENKVQITIEAVDKAREALTDLAKNLQGIQAQGQATGKAMSGLGGILADLKQSWIGLSIGVNQALEILNKIGSTAGKIYEFARAGQDVILAETAFHRMAISVGADSELMAARLRSAAKNLMDDTDLMRRATDFMISGIRPDRIEPLIESFRKLAPYAGVTLPEALNRLGTSLESGNARAIRSLIGYIDLNYELDVYAQKLGKTADQLTDVARVQATWEIIQERARQKTKDLKDTQELGINTFLRFETAWKNMIENMQKGIGPLADLIGWFTKLIEKVNEYSERQEATSKEREARKKFAETPLGESMLGAIGSTGGQGYEEAFQRWWADQKEKEEYKKIRVAPQEAVTAQGGAGVEGTPTWKPATPLEDLRKQQVLIQSINDEETRRLAALDNQVKMMGMQIKGITDEEIAQFKINESIKISNEFAAKRLQALAGIRQAEGDVVGALNLQKEAELTLAMSGRQRMEIAAKFDAQIDKARMERVEKDAESVAKAIEAENAEREMVEAVTTQIKLQQIELAKTEPWKRFEANAAAVERVRELFKTIRDSLAQTMDKIRLQADAYKEMFEKTGEYAQQWVFFRKELLAAEVEELKKAGMQEDDLLRLREIRSRAIERDASRTYQVWVGVAENLSSAFQSGFFDLFKSGLQDLGKIFEDFCVNIVNSFYRAISQMITNWLIFGQITGYKQGMEMGGLIGWLAGLGGGQKPTGNSEWGATWGEPFHKGSHGVLRVVPRFHLGLAPDEFPAILQTGERVLSRQEVAAGIGSAPNVSINVINKTGTQVKHSDVQTSFNGRDMVISIMLDAAQRDMSVRAAYGLGR